MVADTLDELHRAADFAKVPDSQFSGKGGMATHRPHYWLTDEQKSVLSDLTNEGIRAVDFVWV